MIAGSLFSGAGLLDLGLAQAGVEHAWFVERDEFRRGLLAQRWPGAPIHDDIRSASADTLTPVDCIAGGFPCKGASTAGKRTGLAHPETALWAEFERIVRELQPRYVVVENVANILALHGGAVWGTVLGDLAALGYDVAWDCVPAAAVGAPHRRDRVFAVAHAARLREGGAASQARPDGERARQGADASPDTLRPGLEGRGLSGPVADRIAVAADAECGVHGPPGRGDLPSTPRTGEAEALERERLRSDAADGDRGVRVEWGDYEPAIHRWETSHGPAPEPLVRRMDDGNPKLQRLRARVDRSRLSALGDGVHVHVGRLVGEALMELERAEREAVAA